MLNEHFKKAATAVKIINTKGAGMFAALLRFANEHKTNGPDALRDHFKAQERLATVELKVEMGKNSTYKVAKGKLIKAVECGIALVDADGKPVGKTALEQAIKDHDAAASAVANGSKVEPTPFEKFKAALLVAQDLGRQMKDEDMPIAAGLVSDLYKTLADRIPVKAAA